MNKSFWNGRTVLITGATGLLGGWLVKKLLRGGAKVIVLIRNHASQSMVVHENLLRSCTEVEGSFQDSALIRRVFGKYSPQTVFHLAAQTQVGSARHDPVGTFETNIKGSWVLLEACREALISQVILASSEIVYGSSVNLPYRESHPLQAQFPYEVSKSCSDLIGQMYAHTYGLPVCIARCGNLFGGGDMNFARIIPGLIRDTFQNKRFILRSDGKCVRDFLYVEDAVEAYLSLAERLDSSPSLSGEAFNFSLGVRISISALVEKVLCIMGRDDLSPIFQDTLSQEPKERYLSTQKAREKLDWLPKFGIEEGLERTVSWYKQYFSCIGV